MVEKIKKLLKSGNRDDFILAMHLLGKFDFKEIERIIRSTFPERGSVDREHDICFDEDRGLFTKFCYGENFIHVSNRMGSINKLYSNKDYKIEIIC